MSIIKRIRKALHEGLLEFTDHALEEMDNDGLSLADVRAVLMHGILYESNEDDPRGIKYIVRGEVDNQDVDVVCRFLLSSVLRIITVYVVKEPDDE